MWLSDPDSNPAGGSACGIKLLLQICCLSLSWLFESTKRLRSPIYRLPKHSVLLRLHRKHPHCKHRSHAEQRHHETGRSRGQRGWESRAKSKIYRQSTSWQLAPLLLPPEGISIAWLNIPSTAAGEQNYTNLGHLICHGSLATYPSTKWLFFDI